VGLGPRAGFSQQPGELQGRLELPGLDLHRLAQQAERRLALLLAVEVAAALEQVADRLGVALALHVELADPLPQLDPLGQERIERLQQTRLQRCSSVIRSAFFFLLVPPRRKRLS
jgi:hypothetical protein